jgi:hypothetical protein
MGGGMPMYQHIKLEEDIKLPLHSQYYEVN